MKKGKVGAQPAEEPRCPECGVNALRPKCMWELGGACPRHEVSEAYRAAQRAAKKRGSK